MNMHQILNSISLDLPKLHRAFCTERSRRAMHLGTGVPNEEVRNHVVAIIDIGMAALNSEILNLRAAVDKQLTTGADLNTDEVARFAQALKQRAADHLALERAREQWTKTDTERTAAETRKVKRLVGDRPEIAYPVVDLAGIQVTKVQADQISRQVMVQFTFPLGSGQSDTHVIELNPDESKAYWSARRDGSCTQNEAAGKVLRSTGEAAVEAKKLVDSRA